jgi:hypothetical protein
MKMEQQKESGFTEVRRNEKRITDIALVTYLRCIGMEFLRVDRRQFKSTFIFAASKELEDETNKFFNHQATVDPLKYSETLRNLKSFVRQG